MENRPKSFNQIANQMQRNKSVKNLRILLIEDSPLDAELIQTHLLDGGIDCELLQVETRVDYLAALQKDCFDLILSDYSLPSFNGISALEIAGSICPDVPFIFVSGTLGEELAIETLKCGATDYILKHRLGRLVPAIDRALREAQERNERRQAEEELLAVKNELANQLEDLTRLHELSTRLSNTLDLQSVFQEVLSAIAALQDSDMAVLMLYDPKHEDLHTVASIGLSEEYLNLVGRIALGMGPCGTAVAEQRSVIINDVETETDPLSASSIKAARLAGYRAVYSTPLFTRKGDIFGTIATYFRNPHTPSDRKIHLVELYAQQAGWAIENARLYREAQEANRLKDEFLATLSHELRTPLTAMLGWAQLLRGHKFDEETTDRALETIESNTKSLVKIIEDLLDVSRIIRGKLRLNISLFNLASTIEAAIATLRPAANAKNIQLESIIDRSVNLTSGDPDRLQQVVWNLVSNALKFTPEDGRVEIRLEQIDSHAQIKVIDTGIGISQGLLPYVFDRFRQGDSTSTRVHGGLGLGLAIVRHLVELHGGTVSAESGGEGQGATFIVNLPLLQEEEPSQKKEVDPTVIEPSSFKPNPSLEGLRVLVVDDEPDAREFFTVVLQKYGATVRVVGSVGEAIAAIARLKPDILVSDIGMPGEDGYSLIRKIRTREPGREGQIPAIALTAFAREEDRTKALSAGFQKHVHKPVEAAELVAVIANLAGRTIN